MQWMSSATLWLVFITLVITEERVIPLIMKSDSIYTPTYLSFCTHSTQCVTFWSKLIIPAVIYVQCVYGCIRQIIVINLTNSGDSPVLMGLRTLYCIKTLSLEVLSPFTLVHIDKKANCIITRIYTSLMSSPLN